MAKKIFFALVCFVCFVCGAFGAPLAEITSFISKEDVLTQTKNANAILKSSKASLEDIYYSAKIVGKLDSSSCNCDYISKSTKAAISSYDVFYGVTVSKICGCPVVAVGSDVNSLISTGLQSDSFDTFAGAALASKAVGVKDMTAEAIVSRLKSFLAPDGTIKPSLTSANRESSIAGVSVALELLSVINADLKDDTRSALTKIVESSANLLPSGGEEESTVDPTLVSYINAINKKALKLSKKSLISILSGLLDLRFSSSVRVISAVIDSAKILSSGFDEVYFTTISKKLFMSEEENKSFVVKVVDFLGNDVEIEKVEIKSISKAGDSTLYEGKISELGVDVSSLTSGLYTISLSISAKGNTYQVSRVFSVSSPVTVSHVRAGVAETKALSSSDLDPIKSQNGFKDQSASGASTDFIHIAFSVSTAFQKPHQVFVKYTNVESGTNAFFVPSNEGKVDDIRHKYISSMSIADEIATFSHVSGLYTISILVADSLTTSPIEWVVGTVSLSFPPKVVKDLPLYTRSLLHTSDNTLIPLPEIVHKNRPDSKRASAFMALLFTLVVSIPLVALIGFLLSMRFGLQRLKSISNILFVGCVAACLLLYGAYWLSLPLFSFYETIKYLCFLAPATLVIGSYAMADLNLLTVTSKDD